MRIKVTLDNGGGELASETIDLHDDIDPAQVSEAIGDVIDVWVLSPGDTITIREI